MTTLDVAGVTTINMVRTGPRGGSPVVFLHPVGLDLTWWGDQFSTFGPERDLLAFDMPGHGASGALTTPPSFEVMADTLEAVLDAAAAGPAHLVGLSVGGMIAQAFALRRPHLVRSLSLIATLCTFPEPVRDVLRERSRVAREEGMATIAELTNERWFPPSFRDQRPDVLDRAGKSLRAQDGEFHALMWDMIRGLNLEKNLPDITCPTMVVVGGSDGNSPPAAGERIAELIPGASLTVLPGVGHFPPYETPVAFNTLLRRFLAKVDPLPAKENA
ncbi:alpha/beta fold hydrolase [Amycolatopsis pigmentata]|uniref:Alpha/beta fold hydrolase n=1 Tax=Amycolatopsis pigmentata TaxID=450801 RepID=A0ABW5FL73_9PSEU